jgi:gas vesicle protein
MGGNIMDNGKKLVTGLVAGAVMGTIAGMLLAPKSGKENRKMVAEKASKIRTQTGGTISSLKSRIKRTPAETTVEESSSNGAHVLN